MIRQQSHPDDPPLFRIQRESTQLVILEPAVDGVPVMAFDVQVTVGWPPKPARPTDAGWRGRDVDGDDLGLLVEDLPVGRYSVWVRYTESEETLVLVAARLDIT